ncbi:MAG: hypothetical protein H7222_02280 [Methylotenera sp.]|nr:hypothetical protein [Oligoflexia bacterium]
MTTPEINSHLTPGNARKLADTARHEQDPALVLFIASVVYFILQQTIIADQGKGSKLAAPTGEGDTQR